MFAYAPTICPLTHSHREAASGDPTPVGLPRRSVQTRPGDSPLAREEESPEIAAIVGYSTHNVTNWINRFNEEGFDRSHGGSEPNWDDDYLAPLPSLTSPPPQSHPRSSTPARSSRECCCSGHAVHVLVIER